MRRPDGPFMLDVVLLFLRVAGLGVDCQSLAFEADDVLRRALDERFSDYFATSRRWEIKAWQATVTEWERERYMRTV